MGWTGCAGMGPLACRARAMGGEGHVWVLAYVLGTGTESWGHGRDGDGIVVKVERGVGGFIVDGRSVARFGDRVKVVWEWRGGGRRVWTADESLARAANVGHKIKRRIRLGFA